MEHLASTAGSLFDSSIDTAGLVENLHLRELATQTDLSPTEILLIQSTMQRRAVANGFQKLCDF